MRYQDIPTDPGCYLFKDSDDQIIYVGKAKNLKRRVSSYFLKKSHDRKTSHLVNHIKDMEYIVTDNEVEALLLENTLIKKNRPKYNIDLKDTRRYAYIKVTDEEYSRLVTVRNKEDTKDGQVFGPFTDGTRRRQIMDLLISTFRLRTCRSLPKRVCLRYHLSLCKGPCEGFQTKEEYQRNVQQAVLVLRGHTQELIRTLKKDMGQSAKLQLYEHAKELRDRIAALEHLQDRQKMETGKEYNQDIIHYAAADDDDKMVHVLVFNIDKGTILNKQDFSFAAYDEFPLDAFVKRYYAVREIPQEIIIPHALHDEGAILSYLNSLCGHKVTCTVPKQGDKKALLDLVARNLTYTFGRDTHVLAQLKEELKLPRLPRVIECFDISNLGTTNVVASMVQCVDAKMHKAGYRRYRIRTVKGQDDFASMREVVTRRYRRLEHFPDLIVVDGGLGQLGAAKGALAALGVRIPLVSLAKKEELVYGVHLDVPVAIPHHHPSLKLLQQVRDEAHRFAITYQRKLREKSLFG